MTRSGIMPPTPVMQTPSKKAYKKSLGNNVSYFSLYDTTILVSTASMKDSMKFYRYMVECRLWEFTPKLAPSLSEQ